MRVLVDPRLTGLESSYLFRGHGFELLEEIYPPGRETYHFVSGGFLLEGSHVDQTVELVLFVMDHLAQKQTNYINQISHPK